MNENIHKLPQEFRHKIRKVYPNNFEEVLEALLQKTPSAFRVNYLKTNLESLRKRLFTERVRFRELDFPLGSFVLKGKLRDFQRTNVYQDGLVFVQNVSSQIVPIVLNPKDGEAILDLCAAPGAKTTQILSLAPGAEVTAIEKIRTRYYKLMSNLKAQGITTVKPIILDGLWVRKKFPESFDKILLDAPCSCEARFQADNAKSFMYWKLRKVKEMAHKQRKLLAAAVYALKSGGELVYSTCTFSPEENEEAVQWLLNKFDSELELVPIELPIPNAVRGLKGWKATRFSESMEYTRRIIPNDYMEGFFIAKFKKL